jgi:hypothetical protein
VRDQGSRSELVKISLVVLLALGLLAVTAAGCGGDDETPPEATPAETATTATPATEPFAHRLLLTDTECTYEGDTTFSSTEAFEAEVVNESSKLGAFEIAKLDEGHTFAEVEAYVESERQRVAEGLEIVGPPTYMTPGERAQLEPGETGLLVSTVTPGTWVLWCLHEHPPTAFFLITPALELT